MVKLLVKGIFYLVFVIPFVRWVVGLFIPWAWLAWILGIIVALIVAFSLEKSGTSDKILASLFSPNKSVKDTIGQEMSSLFDGGDQAPKGPETTIKCPNCGSQVNLIGGHGKCRACDTAF